MVFLGCLPDKIISVFKKRMRGRVAVLEGDVLLNEGIIRVEITEKLSSIGADIVDQHTGEILLGNPSRKKCDQSIFFMKKGERSVEE